MKRKILSRCISAGALALATLVLASALDVEATTQRPRRRGRSYPVQITTAPDQAMIFLDDVAYGVVGVSPWSGKLVGGSYTLIVQKAGFVAATQTIEVSRNNRTFAVSLEREIKPSFVAVTAASDSSLAGAKVRIDGKDAGVVPLSVQVAQGRHQVEVERPDYEPFAQWVEVTEGQTVSLAPVLKKRAAAPGSLLIDANVPGARAAVDGKPQPQPLPTVVDDLSPGLHVVEVSAEGAATWRQSVTVVSGERTKVAATLSVAAKTGSLLVDADVAGAVIKVDGKQIAEAPPTVIDDLAVGMHAVEAEAEGQSWAGSVEIKAGERAKVTAKLAEKVEKAKAAMSAVERAAADKVAAERAAADKARADKAAAERAAAQASGDRTAAERAAAERAAAERAAADKAAASAGPKAALAAPPPAMPTKPGPTPKPTGIEAQRTRAEQAALDAQEFGRLDARMKTPLGARPLPEGFVALELSAGYPYYVQAQGTVGVTHGEIYNVDVSLWGRSMFTLTEGGGQVRFGLAQGRVFAAAAVARLGGGSGFGGRNSFSFGAGVVGSIVIRERVALSAFANLDAWSERLCPEAGAPAKEKAEGADVCRNALKPSEQVTAQKMLDAPNTERDVGARLGLGVTLEIRASQWLNLHATADVAPGQSERAGYSGLFQTPLIFDRDPGYSGRLGFSLLF